MILGARIDLENSQINLLEKRDGQLLLAKIENQKKQNIVCLCKR